MDLKKHNALLERKIAREKAARNMAEKLLEAKSLELYNANIQLQSSLENVQTKLDHDSNLLAHKAKMDSALLNFSRLFLNQSITPALLQELIDSLVDDNVLLGAQIHVSLKIKQDVIFEHICTAGRHQSWTPPENIDLLKKTTYWDKDNNIFWLSLAEQASCYMGWKILATNSWLSPIQKNISLIGEMLSAAFIRHLTLIKEVKARKQAEASEKATQSFLAMINHELRTPLNGLLGCVELLSDTKLSKQQKKLLATLTSSGELLRNIINDLLDYSKMNANMFELIESPFKVQELVDLLQAIFIHRAREKGLALSVTNDANMPAFLLGDVDRIKQICVNLIGNAIKFTEQGAVNVSFNWQDSQLVFKVKDSGTGIKQKNIQLLFKPFSQIDLSSKKAHEGTGLGLSICKKLSQLMGGDIGVESSFGQGSTFSVYLPLTPCESKKTPETTESTSKEQYADIRILVVEDVKTNQMIIKMMLKKLAISPSFADNGLDALEKLKSNQFDIIFMDCRMPVMDGFSATAKLRDQGYTKPIIALTAGTTSTERELCLNAGMNDVLFKPYKLQDLQTALGRWHQSARS